MGLCTFGYLEGFRPDPLAKLQGIEWESILFPLFMALVFYSTSVYGRMRPMFGGGGGGSPTPVRLHLERATTFAPNNSVSGFRVDENDRGYYLLKSEQDRAANFVSR